MIKIIVAKASNNVIGNNNELIWHLPNDLKNFKKLTSDHPIIMGRKTYQSLGRPLPNRTNIVITRDSNFKDDKVVITYSLEESINKAKEINNDLFIIGGGDIYKQAMEIADELYITEVHHEFEGDTFFPEIDEDNFEEISREHFNKDEKHLYAYSFVIYKRIKESIN
ncbi:dihydrofolate reductase [Faecalibacter rhinopitheci]|uniref:Dihydrofolate reductase n=1 Tax=Faecalibacter rhinopitheci TaxID=2779678 RepID=A0A8J7FQY2_9FLAO|nr:dihydrofolate reductase [Faecalibacter rhinopitheci]MBF0596758.1 dihydrofolate reductase [Faecalibacter rhinopitheci]MBQ0146874.1 dihydrofolate reductase [Candidatus Onthonaster equi]